MPAVGGSDNASMLSLETEASNFCISRARGSGCGSGQARLSLPGWYGSSSHKSLLLPQRDQHSCMRGAFSGGLTWQSETSVVSGVELG